MYKWIDCEVHLTEPSYAVLRLIPILPDDSLCILLSMCECIVKFAVGSNTHVSYFTQWLCALHKSWLYPTTSVKISLSLEDVFVFEDGFVVLSVKNNNTS